MKIFTQSIVTACMCLLLIGSIQASPKAELESDTFNFGYSPQNSKLSHKYWIHSTGDEELKIIKVVPGCGCTKAPLEKNVIQAGDSTYLEIIFSTKKYKNKISKRPKFFTNVSEDAQRISFMTHVVADNEKTFPLMLQPFKVNLSSRINQSNMHLANSTTIDEQENSSFKITSSSEKELTIRIVEFDKELFDVIIPDNIQAGETVYGNILLITKDVDVSFKKSVTIEVNDENTTRFTIPVVYNAKIISQK